MRTILTTAVSGVFLFATVAIASAWEINSELSELSFVTIKKEHVAENMTLSGISGALSNEGMLSVSLDMSSVDSGIAVRDQRLGAMLFQVASFPTATFTAQLDMSEFSSLAVGDSVETFVEGDLTLLETTDFVAMDLLVTRASESRVVVTSKRPSIVDGTFFGLEGGIEALREVAGLSHISYSVPVMVTVVLDR